MVFIIVSPLFMKTALAAHACRLAGTAITSFALVIVTNIDHPQIMSTKQA